MTNTIPSMNPAAADELKAAVFMLTEATNCTDELARDLIDTIARYAILQAQGCLPAGWGRRDKQERRAPYPWIGCAEDGSQSSGEPPDDYEGCGA